MKRAIAALFTLLLAGCQSMELETPEIARPRPVAPSVPTLSGDALRDFLVGKTLRYNLNGVASTYFADGRYGYRDYEVRDGGSYTITGDEVCIAFEDGGHRCDQYALIGSDYYRIEEGGRRTKVDRVVPAA
ncbi:hypothetical protein AB4Z34_12915 [Ensifer sp. 2YAB10]|jgi:hypothetical protein|uniref:hypothetical protein n=1 Tax=Ensifer TaxID=106591 RepID=UPI000DE23806|nr:MULTISPECIES: hypothetical protein [Ensifer]MBK5565594.1 hypothetical protein [Ensifer sp. SSB1]MBZ7921969.1 hypothetical protein [Ensifer adhaerens]UAX94361.1 hypothetical protein LAC78_09250 [Ensifer adhaerens]UAY01996.1 hypothetical protein LAC80_09260 [Ensifer adhaerens]UAY09379.1 hypothetical protein LAC81_09255 [Ensifer adhaerens]